AAVTVWVAIPEPVARFSNLRICTMTCSRSCCASPATALWRSCTASSSKGLAASTIGFRPRPRNSLMSACVPSARAGRGAATGGGTGRAPTGCAGRTMVASSSGSPRPCVFMPSSPDRPQLQVQAGEVVAEVERDAARGLQLAPQRRLLVELEVQVAGVVRDLPGRHLHRGHADAGQLQVDQVADLLDRPDLGLLRKLPAHLLGRGV